MGLLEGLGFFRTDKCKKAYTLGRVVGSGSYATVKLATCKADGTQWAVKIIKKAALRTEEDQAALRKEVAIMEDLASLNHENIVLLKEIFDSSAHFYLVMELCTGGEVFDRIVEKEKYSEHEARVACRQLASALAACHKRGIVHRDLKPQNMLYKDRDSEVIKLCDFGLANILEANRFLATACGTPGYVAPEVLKMGGYKREVDMWSLGVILYILLCGFPPFADENQQRLFKKIKAGKYNFPSPFWDQVSEPAKMLVSKLLTVNPSERLTAEEFLKDAWVAPLVEPETPPLVGFHQNLVRYNMRRKFRAGIMTLQVATHISKLSTGGSLADQVPLAEADTTPAEVAAAA